MGATYTGKPKKGNVTYTDTPQSQERQYRSIPEQFSRGVGLTGRYLVEGLSDIADIGGNVVRRGLQQAPGLVKDESGNLTTGTPLQDRFKQSYGEASREGLDAAGFPAPETPMEEMVAQGSRYMAGALPFTGAGPLLAHGASQVTRGVGNVMASQPGMQAASAWAAGMGGELAKQEGFDTTGQIVAALTAGLAPMAVKSITQSAMHILTPMPSQVDDIVARYDLRGIPVSVVENLRKRVSAALDAGSVDEIQLKRMVDYAKTGARPTRASVSQDPVDITRQKNLAGMGAQSSNTDMQILSRVENENARTIISGLDDIAKGTPLDLKAGSAAIINTVKKRDNWLNQFKNNLYKKAEETHGREILLDREGFANGVYTKLKEIRRMAFLPKKIKTIIDDADTPFTVDEMDTLETIISEELKTAYRGSKGNVVMALKAVQNGLRNIEPAEQLGAESIKAFRIARKFNFKLSQWREKSPAIKAITDGIEPDKFMNDFVIGGTSKASDKSVARLMTELRKDPEAAAIVRNQVAAWIKDRALSGNPDEAVKVSYTGLRNALNKIGDNKLKVLFDKKDIDQLRALERVLLYEQNQPIGSAVNNSKTAVTHLGTMMEWAEAIASKIPYGRALVAPITRGVSKGAEASAAVLPNIGVKQATRGFPNAVPLGVATGELAAKEQTR